MVDATNGTGPLEAVLDDGSSGAQGREKVPRVENKMDTSGGDNAGAASSGLDVALPGDGGGSAVANQAVTPISAVLSGIGPGDQRQVMSPNIGGDENSRVWLA